MTRSDVKTALIALSLITPLHVDKEMADIDAELDHRPTNTMLLGDWILEKSGDKYDLRRL
jgi:hypothetical protein